MEKWDGVERRKLGIDRREGMNYEVLPDCIQRTAEAVAEGHEMAAKLELKIQEMRREREQQLAEINKAIALQTQNIKNLTELGKSNQEQIVVLKEIAMETKRTVDLLMQERKDKLEEKKEVAKPVRSFWMGLLEKVVWSMLILIALAIYEYIRARL